MIRFRTGLIVCAVLLCLTEVAAEEKAQRLVWEKREKRVNVRDNGSVTIQYRFALRITKRSSRELLFPLPRENGLVALTEAWGRMHCLERQADVAKRDHHLVFSDVCDNAGIEYGFEVRTTMEGFADLFADSYPVTRDEQVLEQSYRLELESPGKLFWRLHGSVPVIDAPEESGTSGRSFHWIFGPSLTPGSTPAMLEVSLSPDWAVIAGRFEQLWNSRCEDFTPPAPAELGIEGADEETLVTGLQDYLQQRFSYRENRQPQHYRLPADCRETWESESGDCKDLTILGVRILNSWGMKVFPLLKAASGKSMVESLPNPMIFDHAVVGRIKGETVQLFDMWGDDRWHDGSSGAYLPVN